MKIKQQCGGLEAEFQDWVGRQWTIQESMIEGKLNSLVTVIESKMITMCKVQWFMETELWNSRKLLHMNSQPEISTIWKQVMKTSWLWKKCAWVLNPRKTHRWTYSCMDTIHRCTHKHTCTHRHAHTHENTQTYRHIHIHMQIHMQNYQSYSI